MTVISTLLSSIQESTAGIYSKADRNYDAQKIILCSMYKSIKINFFNRPLELSDNAYIKFISGIGSNINH